MSTAKALPRQLPAQPGILQDTPSVARYLRFELARPKALPQALQALSEQVDGAAVVAGLGADAVAALGAEVPGLHAFPQWAKARKPMPATPTALWLWLRSTPAHGRQRATDTGDLLARSRAFEAMLAPALKLAQVVDGFTHARNTRGAAHDLSGFEDGTENPADGAAVALVRGQGAGLDGGSLVAVPQWQNDWRRLQAMSREQQDLVIGRRLRGNAEINDAPASAHVKRTAQENFAPEAFIWRRSMPWAAGQDGGLMFVAFGATLDAFEAQLHRMVGLDDGTSDALYRFTTPVTGFTAWCPPLRRGRLDLRALGLDA